MHVYRAKMANLIHVCNKNKSEFEMHLNVYNFLNLKVVTDHSISDRNSHFSCQLFKLNKIV